MRGIFVKSFHETWLTTLLFGMGLACALALLTYILPQVQEGIGDVLVPQPLIVSAPKPKFH